MPITATAEPDPQPAGLSSKRRNLIAACLAHALHDGYTDGLYAFLPAWQSQFGLSYAGIAIVRALYFGPMGALQMPANRLLRTLWPCAALVVSTLVAAVGFVFMAAPLGFAGLCVGLVVAGAGSSVQHPRGSLLVAETYAAAARRPLGIYNFSGDLGKATVPAIVALLLPLLAWRPVVGLLALLGLGVTLALLTLSPRVTLAAPSGARAFPGGRGRSGFAWLMTSAPSIRRHAWAICSFSPFSFTPAGEPRPPSVSAYRCSSSAAHSGRRLAAGLASIWASFALSSQPRPSQRC